MTSMRAWILFPVILAGGCIAEKPETPTKGTLHVLVSESVAPAMQREVGEFMAIYARNGAMVTYDLLCPPTMPDSS